MPRFRFLITPSMAGKAKGGPLIVPPDDLASAQPSDKDVINAFRRAARSNPDDPDYLYILGEALAHLGRYEEARRFLQEAVQMNPEVCGAREALGLVLWELGRFEECLAAFKEVLRLDGTSLVALNGKGVALGCLGQYAAALHSFHEAARLDRSRADVYNNLGITLWALGKHREALRSFQRAVQLSPDGPSPRRNLGLALAEMGRSVEAEAALKESIKLAPDDAETRADLAALLEGLGRASEAVASFKEALLLDPKCLSTRLDLQESFQAASLKDLHHELEPKEISLAMRLALSAIDLVLELSQRVRYYLVSLKRLKVWIPLVIVSTAGYGGWLVVPPYVQYFVFKDKMREIARAPVQDDAEVLEILMHEVRERRLEDYIHESSFVITTKPRWRNVVCDYDVSIQILPGLARKVHFRIQVEEPLFWGEKPIFL